MSQQADPVLERRFQDRRPALETAHPCQWSAFGSLDHYLWHITYRWATWRHANKPRRWIAGRYFGKFSKFRNDHWVFGDRDSGAYLVRFSWTAIERHVPVKGAASPDDPAWPATGPNGGRR